MKWRDKIEYAGLTLVIAIGAALRVRQLACFEWKDDQARYLINGLCALRDNFLAWHGMAASNGLPLPPGNNFFIGLLALGGTTPGYFAGCFVVLSLLTLVAVYWGARHISGPLAALRLTAILAAAPVLIWNSSNLWGPNGLPLMVLVFLFFLWRYLNDGRARDWLAAGAVMVLTGWIWHLAGFFLIFALAYAAWERRLRWPNWLGLGGIAAVVLGPWLWFLCFYWDRTLLPGRAGIGEKFGAFLAGLGSCGNGFFFFNYFAPGETVPFLARYGGGSVAIWLSLGLGAAFCWGGILWFLRGHIRHLTPWHRALLLASCGAILGMGLGGIRIYYHYLLLILLPLSWLTVLGWGELPGRWRLPFAALGLAALLWPTLAAQNGVLHGHGHYYEFGPSGNFIASAAAACQREFAAVPVKLQVVAADPEARRKLDPIAFLYYLDSAMQPGGIPARLVIGWDAAAGRYWFRIVRSGSAGIN